MLGARGFISPSSPTIRSNAASKSRSMARSDFLPESLLGFVSFVLLTILFLSVARGPQEFGPLKRHTEGLPRKSGFLRFEVAVFEVQPDKPLIRLSKENASRLRDGLLGISASMLDFFNSDSGKVALGGVIALSGQLAVPVIAWIKEAWFAASKDRREAEYLAMRLVLVFDELVNDCYNVVHDPLMPDREGCSEATVGDPTLTIPAEGDYKALPRHLMYEIISMPNKLEGIKEGMASAWEHSGPPDYDEFFEYRREHWSRLGLKALDLIDALCRQYKIPPPERPKFYTPKQSFQDELASIEEDKNARRAENDRLVASVKP
jgi:hypothetical protein